MATTKTHRQTAHDQQAGRQRLIMILVAVAVLVFAVLIAVFSSQESGSAVTVEDVAGSPEVAGELSPAPTEGEPDPVVDTPAPVAEGADFDGSPVTIGEQGTPQLLMFVASWCGACQQELPMVVDWLQAGNLPDDVEFTTVVTWLDDTRPNWPPEPWLDEEGYDGRVIVDDAEGSIAAAYGQPATPYWVALDGEGRIVQRTSGLLSEEQVDELAASVSGT